LTRRIILLPQAIQDLDHIFEPVLGRVLDRVGLLRMFPEFGPTLEGRFSGCRSFLVEPFRIVYRIAAEDRIEVLFVIHVRRELRRNFKA
jgi:plasmid stabilization system protein ParE